MFVEKHPLAIVYRNKGESEVAESENEIDPFGDDKLIASIRTFDT